MLDIAIIIILLIGFFIGLRRGFILQIIHLTGFIVAFITAYVYYDNLAPRLKLWVPFPNVGEGNTVTLLFDESNIEMVYYNAIAFFIVFITVKIIMQIVGSMLDFVAHLPVLKQVNGWAGGLLGFIEVYLLIFILLYIVALIPMQVIQDPVQNSIMAESIIKNTPIFSKQIQDLWFEYLAL